MIHPLPNFGDLGAAAPIKAQGAQKSPYPGVNSQLEEPQ